MSKDTTITKIYRPKEVEIAIKLLLTSLVFGVLVGYLSISVAPDDQNFGIYIDLLLLSSLFSAYLTYKITKNTDWARKLYIAFTVISIPIFVSDLISGFFAKPLVFSLQAVNILIQITAMYYLTKKASKEWFLLVKRKK